MEETQEIRLLPDFIANQIAAGEVVQRPESVVKELVENALDAGADTVTVVIRGAGKKLIHVVDNGKGMSKSDLELCVLRHSTSKIATQDDLSRITTLGFRGEALASIASVAQLEIRTRRRDSDTGWRLQMSPGQPPEITPFNCEPGTQIFVKNLFYNVPARRKFLRSDQTEFRHCAETMQKFALSRFAYRFVFFDEESMVFDVSGNTLEERWEAFYGKDSLQDMAAVNFTSPLVSISGLCGTSRSSAKAKNSQFFFLNGRIIANRRLNHAVQTALEYFQSGEGFAPYCLFLTVDPHRVDINVHPQKHEVKFDDENSMYTAVLNAVTEALRNNNTLPSFGEVLPPTATPTIAPFQGALVNMQTGEIVERSSSASYSPRPPAPASQRSFTGGSAAPDKYSFAGGTRPASREYSPAASTPPPPVDRAALQPFLADESGIPLQASLSKRPIVWNGRWAILLQPENVRLVSLPQVAKMCLFHEVMSSLEGRSNPIGSQELLFPVQMTLAPAQSARLDEWQDDLRALGFSWSLDGEAVVMNAVPSAMAEGEEADSLHRMLNALEENGGADAIKRRNILATAFAGTAHKSKSYSRDEAEHLLSLFEKIGSPSTDYQRQPLWVDLSETSIMDLLTGKR